ncbi:MAG TPA: ABC transporter permease [Gammaproteobacteria bacterium]|nr:ABC transporter permease [Gammaproteobacteria bacterium]
MTLHPILAALKKHKAGVTLITLQIALTLAIVCNAVFIIGQRMERIARPTGINEQNLFLITQLWVGTAEGGDPASSDKLDALLLSDLATLRKLPDVESVTPTNSLPLLNSSWTGSVSLKPDQSETAHTAYYFVGKDMLKTFGVRLLTGRGFNDTDITHRDFRGRAQPAVVIVTQALADKLFPKNDALGKPIYLNGSSTPSTIVGIVERMQVPGTDSWTNNFTWYSVLIPTRLNAVFSRYAVRTRPGRLDAVMRATPQALYAANPMRVIQSGADYDDSTVHSFAEIRAHAYRADRGMAILMGVICVILLGVTGAGIVGLTSFWVGQRHKQIGIRRALGARKRDILRYFQLENLLIAGGGAVVGIALAISLNLWLIRHFEMERMPVWYVLFGVAVVLVLGQAAVFAPARRASNVPPVVATRSV